MDWEATSVLGPLQRLETRMLWPFFFDVRSAPEAVARLTNLELAGRKNVWEADVSAPAAYREELLDHVERYLFGSDAKSCRYLKLSNAAVNSWFREVVAELRAGFEMPLKLIASPGIELFLSPYGVGVLSLTIAPGAQILEPDSVMDFNYRLARIHRGSTTWLRAIHPQDDAQRWEKIPAENRGKVPPPPAEDAPLAQRLGTAGGKFSLTELVAALLAPLAGLHLAFSQENFNVFTVASFGKEVTFDSPEACARMAPFLSALTQVEEPHHAGAPAGPVSLANKVLNRRHWAAVGMLGTAHLLADQPAPLGRDQHPFNEQRVERIRDKYFIPYLFAFLQRLTLQRTSGDAASIAGAAESDATESRFRALRQDLLDFSVHSYFTQVSSREALHQYYRLSRRGLDVAENWDHVHHAVADIESKYDVRRSQAVANSMDKSLHLVDKNIDLLTRLQQAAEIFEVLILSVYLAHLWHMAAHGLYELLEHSIFPGLCRIEVEVFNFWGVVASAILGLIIGRWIVRQAHKHKH